ncbi:unnamed protein product [Pedinophyceae sp. YPF-701]|nr:unnamed protein product [Pedinophyceae sp. YPF-701]
MTTRAAAAQYAAGMRLTGVGSSAPAKIMTNDDLGKLVETNDEWISARTGIRARRILAEGESINDHAIAAARAALDMAGVAGEDVDMVIMCTSSPDDLFGSACQVQAAIGATGAVAFDLTAACSGFVVGLITATMYLRCGAARNIVLIGADGLSRYVDWGDRNTCILFGDGAGAVVMQGDAGAGGSCALLGQAMHSNGEGNKSLNAPFGHNVDKPASGADVGRHAEFQNLYMNGREVFRFAVRSVPDVIQEALDSAGITKDDVDWLVLHQANQRILDSTADRFEFPKERVVTNLERYGNTSAASIPLVLDEAVRDGRIKGGDVLAFAGFGAGLTWASAIARWGVKS